MGKFDGYLICSDLDGTFRAGTDTVEVNRNAIKYFIDNGGKFTFTTGRTISHLRECNFNDIINAPVGVYNGAVIYDLKKELVLYEKGLNYSVGDFVDAIRSGLYYRGMLIVHWDCLDERCESVSFEYVDKILKDIKDIKPLKIVCVFSSENEADSFKAFVSDNEFFSDSIISKTWSVGVEFNSLQATKGTSIEFIKRHLGNIHTAIGVGDYENDISLITHADIGVAVGNAVDKLKCIADMVVRPATEYAIKDLIEKIENRL